MPLIVHKGDTIKIGTYTPCLATGFRIVAAKEVPSKPQLSRASYKCKLVSVHKHWDLITAAFEHKEDTIKSCTCPPCLASLFLKFSSH